MRTHTLPQTLRRAIAVALTLLFALSLPTSALAVTDAGGDHGACTDGRWLKADWTEDGWEWEAGTAHDGDAPAHPVLTITSSDDGDPMTVAWTSDTYVLKATVKASTEYASFDGGYSGTVTGIDRHAISHIVFCYGEEPILVPSVELEKTPDGTTVTHDPEGDPQRVTYTYTVTNTGQTALTGITLVDDVLGTITLADTDLAVGGSTTGTATHVVTAADAAVGRIVNVAEVTATAPDQTTVRDSATATVRVQKVAPVVLLEPGIALEKTALVTPDDDGRKVVMWRASTPAGTEITYEYVITNTGETPLTGITLVDDVLGTITLADTDLAVGGSTTGTATHVVTAADAAAGKVTNTASTTATDPEGTEVAATAEETVLVSEVRGEIIDKEVEGDVIDKKVEGDVVTRDEQLPVTGAATTVLAMAATLSLATGAGMLRASRRRR